MSQAKLLEEALTGYQSKLDLPKAEKEEIRESWSKVVLHDLENILNENEDDDFALPQRAIQSGFDSYMFLETPDEECLRRTEGMNEDDHVSTSRITQTNEAYESKVKSLKTWCEQFGLIAPTGECKVTLNQEVCAQDWTDKDQVKEQVLASLKKVMAFKQEQFDTQREAFKEQLEAEEPLGQREGSTLSPRQTLSKKETSQKGDTIDASKEPSNEELSAKGSAEKLPEPTVEASQR